MVLERSRQGPKGLKQVKISDLPFTRLGLKNEMVIAQHSYAVFYFACKAIVWRRPNLHMNWIDL